MRAKAHGDVASLMRTDGSREARPMWIELLRRLRILPSLTLIEEKRRSWGAR
jgi:hypothetical protein